MEKLENENHSEGQELLLCFCNQQKAAVTIADQLNLPPFHPLAKSR